MAKVLVIAEHLDGKLNASTAKTVSAAAAVKADAIDVVVLAADPTAVAADAAQIAGVAKVLAVANAANANAIAQVLAPQIAKLAAGYTHVFAPSTTFGKDLLPCVAALLGVNQVSDLMAVEGPHTFKRPIYAGNAIITVETPADQTVVATVRTASWPEAAKGGSATVEAASVDATLPTHTRYVGLAAGKSDRPDLQSAKRVVSGGRGVGSAENFKVIYALADKLGAAVGASRAAVDAGYCPNEMQVGQTGKIIAPELYVAIGISGAIQHLTGIKDAGTEFVGEGVDDLEVFLGAHAAATGDHALGALQVGAVGLAGGEADEAGVGGQGGFDRNGFDGGIAALGGFRPRGAAHGGDDDVAGRSIDGDDGVAGVDGTLEGVAAFHRHHVRHLGCAQQGGDAGHQVLAEGG